MYKKVFILLNLVVVHILLLSGCKQTPQEVQEKIDNHGDNRQINQEIELEYCTVNELQKVDLNNISDDYNISIPKKFDFSGITDIALLDIQKDSGCFNFKDEYLTLFDIDENTVEYRPMDDEGTSYIYESDDKKAQKYFALSDDGNISYISDVSYALTEDEVLNVDTYGTYSLGLDDISDKTIVLGNEPVSFNDMITKADNWAKKHFNPKDMNYGVVDIYERKLETKNGTVPQLSMLMGLYYKGILFEPYISDVAIDKNGNSIKKTSFIEAELDYTGQDKITNVFLKAKYKLNSATAIDKVITPECALKIINKTFSGFNKIDASDFRIIYGIFPSSDMAGQFEGRPVYAFWINKDYNGISDFGISILPEHYIYVDMITGEVITDYDIGQDDM